MTSGALIRTFAELDETSEPLVGGKGMNLALLTHAGLPVPPGFCITSDAYREAVTCGLPLRSCDQLSKEIRDAYQALGSPIVAVRSSATMEDGEVASFAGQQETILGVQGEAPLIAAVLRCWQSLFTERAIAYRKKQNIADDMVAMAVVVQTLVDAEMAGVLFTRDPLDVTGQRMMIEAAWGLGESVVSGEVMPDRFHTDRNTGHLLEKEIHTQRTMHTRDGVREVEISKRDQPCLNAEQLVELTRLGKQIEEYYGQPRDIEWAWADGRAYILQARPITAITASEIEAVKQTEIARISAMTHRGGTIWARYNLSEVLPTPTPMSWSIVQQLVSGSGGFGTMYRALGFDPDPLLNERGFIDLIAGRPYVNLSLEPKLYFRDFPYAHDFARIKANPSLAMYPTPTAHAKAATSRTWWRLPAIFLRMWLAGRRMKRCAASQAARLESEIYPTFKAKVLAARSTDLMKLSTAKVIEFIHQWIDLALVKFASQSLQPSMFAATAMQEIKEILAPMLGEEGAAAEAQALMIGVHPPADCDLPDGLQSLADRTLSRQDFMERFGHRGPDEMELASPRWSEDAMALPASSATKEATHAQSRIQIADRLPLLAEALMLDRGEQRKLERSVATARKYLSLREASKHYLIMGLSLIRGALLELGRRTNLGDGVFFLELSELDVLASSDASALLGERIAQRQRHRRIALMLAVPPVIFSDDLDAIGRPMVLDGAADLKGTPVSFGMYEGECLVLEKPVAADSVGEGFVLVCPSTDPAWVPLFLKAKALIMESGGVLSHGAIVAREFGIPAVAGIADVHRRLRTGDRVRVDGTSGAVQIVSSAKEADA